MAEYEVLRGKHVDEFGVMHGPGETFLSNVDVVKRFGSEKFRKVGNKPVPEGYGEKEATAESNRQVAENEAAKEDILTSMTIEELKSVAAEEEIDVSDCKKKDDYINKINNAMDAR